MREAADLADRLGDALEQVRVVVHQPVRAVVAARLLVGEEGEHDVARRLAARCGSRSRTTARIIASMSFMSTAPRPQTQPSRDLAGERVDRPVGGVGRYDVEVTVDQQRRPARGRRPPSRATTLARPGSDSKICGSRPTSASLAGDVLGRRALPRAECVAVVARVDPDQLAAEVDDLVLALADSALRCGLDRRICWPCILPGVLPATAILRPELRSIGGVDRGGVRRAC